MTEKTSTSFAPRVFPRPEYPPFEKIAKRWAWVLLRDAVVGVLLCAALYAPYVRWGAALANDRLHFLYSLIIAHTGTYVVFNGGLMLLEYLKFQPLLRCHIPRKEAETPTKELYTSLAKDAALNHCVTSPLVAYFALYPLLKNFLGMPETTAPLPPLPTLAALFVAAHTFNDFAFYWSHRLFHSKLLYARFHKQHHTFKGTVGAAAEFAGPVETLLSNQLPTVGLMLLVGAHPLVQCVWLFLRLTQTYEVHSGYDFSDTWLNTLGICSPDHAHHDHHHTVNMGNFGAEHTDWLFGTMDHYLREGHGRGYVDKRRAKKAEKAQ